MIYFIDQTSEGDHHMVFNASMIKILMLLYPDATLTAVGIASNQESYKQLLGADELKKLRFQTIPNPKVSSGFTPLKAMNYIRKEAIRFSTFRNVLKNTKSSDLIFLSITTFTAFTLFKYTKQFYSANTIAVLHGDIDFIYFPTSRLEKINARAHKSIFRKKLPSFKYLLLNKIAKKNLVRDGYLKADEVYEIDHPFSFLKNDYPLRSLEAVKPIKIGHIGSMEVERKNSHYIYRLAGQFKAEIEAKELQFRVAGLITPGVLPYKNELVNEVVGNQTPGKPAYLTRAQYEQELAALDYSIFFYPEHQYVYRASGAVVDVINSLIPVITLRHPFFEYLFSLGGNIGFMCENMEEVTAIIKRIADKDPAIIAQYQDQQRNLKQLQGLFNVNTIAADLKQQMAANLKASVA